MKEHPAIGPPRTSPNSREKVSELTQVASPGRHRRYAPLQETVLPLPQNDRLPLVEPDAASGPGSELRAQTHLQALRRPRSKSALTPPRFPNADPRRGRPHPSRPFL